MRIRKLLLIHTSRSFRALIKKYIFAELSDIHMVEAGSGQQALGHIDEEGFDVIVSPEKLKDMGLKDVKIHQESSVVNSHTPLIIISESESNKACKQLVQSGFEHVVQIRLRPADLIKKINTACNPRRWRKDMRYHILNATVQIASSNSWIEAALINISMGGVLVEMSTEDPQALLKGLLRVAIKIPLSDKTVVIDDMTAKLLRLETVAWNTDHIPNAVRATFIFMDLKPGSRGKLEELIMMAKKDKLAALAVTDS